MALQTPTQKQIEILTIVEDDEEFDDVGLGNDLDKKPQAMLARLSGLRQRGWVESYHEPGYEYLLWRLTAEAKEQMGFFRS